ncbi:MAG: hypothetical protein P4L87_22190 [Formivibrio sp.]|nr:hypothetical protein [Formivibrio sp.]
MALPPPSDRSVYWKDYEIDTPAFRLSPLEKPDMSPYLLHMTGKQAIYGILAAGDTGHGKINAAIPSQTKSKWYEAPVVCFTESPLFAVDAFRYIKFDRWKQDLRYGLCFSKERLVAHGVRPVFYAGSALVTEIKALNDAVGEIQPAQQQEQVAKVLSSVIPIMNSLMEYEQKQGFIWEREWRHPDSEGLTFDYEDIEVICCPDEECEAIAQLLGEQAKRIQFVNSWDQYDDVVSFLKSRSESWKSQVIPAEDDLVKHLREAKQERSKLAAYKAYAERLNAEMALIEECTAALETKIDLLSTAMGDDVEEYCCVCGNPFDEEVAPILWNEDEGDYICSGCYGEFAHKCQADD